MSERRDLKSLPDEILLQILQYFTEEEQIELQLVSKTFLRICRDNHYWRCRCLGVSAWGERVSLFRRGAEWVDEDGVPLNIAAPEDHEAAQYQGVIKGLTSLTLRRKKREYSRIAANWDPTFPGEKANWYHEFIQRAGRIVTNWFERPRTKNDSESASADVRGVALYAPSNEARQLFAVSPLDDGSVCIWDVKGSKGRQGSILCKSRPGLLLNTQGNSRTYSSDGSIDRGIIECVSVDNERHHAFFAIGSNLVEVDLQSLAVVATTPFENPIMTLSTVEPSIPLTVGTANGLYLHDYRTGYAPREQQQDIVEDSSHNCPTPGNRRQHPQQHAAHAPPGPLCIHHMSSPGHRSQLSDDIFVAGRFTSILHYDRRMFSSIKDSVYSGARLCSLASLPYPFSSITSDLRRRLELTQEQVTKFMSVGSGRTLIACGEYNTKGSLELYGIASNTNNNKYGCCNSTTKNRQMAASSKLLSVITHGNRILFSDGQGYLKWVERDGFTEVRRHKIGGAEDHAVRSLFTAVPEPGDLALKLLSTQREVDNGIVSANDDDVLFMTGETLGLVSFSSKPAFSSEDFVEDTKSPEEMAREDEEQLYAENMRLALERQADEVRFIRNLGMPRDRM